MVLWAALTLRYFQIAERASFTIVAGLLLLFWYAFPTDAFNFITGELEGDIEMFFISGIVMVTAGTFLVVYNADIVLPAVAAVGQRFGRHRACRQDGRRLPPHIPHTNRA